MRCFIEAQSFLFVAEGSEKDARLDSNEIWPFKKNESSLRVSCMGSLDLSERVMQVIRAPEIELYDDVIDQ
jgi:hypothetical protein